MVSVPLRALPLFCAIAKLTKPLPDPLAPDVIVSHPALLAAIQGQPAAAVTVVDTLLAFALTLALVAPSANVQPLAWLTVNVTPATASVPLRAGPEFAATL